MMESESSHTLPSPPESSTPTTVVDTSTNEEGSSRKRAREASTQKSPVPPKRKSPYWDHCEKGTRALSDESIQQIGVCNYCKTKIPSVNGCTSGLKNHLVRRCKLSPLYQVGENIKGQTLLTTETLGQGSQIIHHSFSQKRCELKLTEFVIIDEASFRAVEGNGFTSLLHELQPKFRIPDRKKVAGMVYTLFLEEKNKIKRVISEQRLSITTDTWTSIQNINYMVVTAHFLDRDWKLHKRIINFTKITSHVGEEICKMIEVCLREWGIEKVFSIVVDNASNNDTAIDYLKRRMRIEKTLLFDGKYLHLRCACHILNLIVKDGLKELNSSIKSIRNAVVFLHSSPARLNKFREFAVLAKFSSSSTVPMDVKTRWNSTYKMFDVALKYRRVFERMYEEWMPFMKYFNEKDDNDRERMGPPIVEDWENARAFIFFLKNFYDATLVLSASKTPTSQLIYQSMVAIQVKIMDKCVDDSEPILKKVAIAMKEKFEKYWGDWNKINHILFIANVLDPRNKLQMIKVSVKKMGGDAKKVQEHIDQVKSDLITLWEEYKGENDSTIEKRQNTPMEIDGDVTNSRGDTQFCDFLYDRVDEQNEEEQLHQISNEVDKYLADEIEKRSNPNFDLLTWWKGYESKYPILSRIAKDIFVTPSSTVASESAFSLGKRVVDPFRTSLSPRMVEALVCTNDWLKAEDFSLYKDPTDEDLELYKEIEEIEKNTSINQESAQTISPASTLST